MQYIIIYMQNKIMFFSIWKNRLQPDLNKPVNSRGKKQAPNLKKLKLKATDLNCLQTSQSHYLEMIKSFKQT